MDMIEVFAREMQDRQQSAGHLLRAALGKARGQALRLALVLEMLWWRGEDGYRRRPLGSARALSMPRRDLMGDYFLPMAERVFGDIITRTKRPWCLDSSALGPEHAPKRGAHSASAVRGPVARFAHGSANPRRRRATRR